MYSVPRMMILKKMTVSQINELHERENKREFAFPAFNIGYLFGIKRPFVRVSESTEEDYHIVFSDNRPNLADIDSDVYTTQSGSRIPAYSLMVEGELEYLHAWDYCIYNCRDIDVPIRNETGIYREKEKAKYDLKGASDN